MRLFFALDIQQQDKLAIHTWRQQYISAPVKPVALTNFHITLSFLGTITENKKEQLVHYVNEIYKAIQIEDDSTLCINHLGIFQQPKVLYLGLSSTPAWLALLADNLKNKTLSLGIYQEKRDYLPHLTLYRKATKLPDIANINIKLHVSSFSLYRSESTPDGVKYSPLHTWPINPR